MRAKIFIVIGAILAVFAFTGATNVYASPENSSAEAFDYLAEYRASGADRLYDELPGYAADALEESGVDAGDLSSVTNINPSGVMQSILQMTADEMDSPLSALGVVIALLLFASVCRSGEGALEGAVSAPLSTIITLSVMLTIAAPVISLIESAGEAVDSACRFTVSFGAVFAGILLANGQTVSAAGFSAFLSGATSVSSVCVNETVLPFMRIVLALTCVSSLSENINTDAIIRFFEKYAKWILSFLAVVITAALGISGLLSSSADGVASRTAKFIISGSVPVIGGAMSEAYLSIKAGMAMVRHSAGAFGIIGTAYIFLPVIIRTALWNFVAGLGAAVCEILNLSREQKLFRSVSAMLSTLLGVVVFSMFLLTLGGIVVIMQRQI